MLEGLGDWRTLATALGWLCAALPVSLLLHWLCWRVLRAFSRHTSTVLDESLVAHCRRPTLPVFAAIAVAIAVPMSAPAFSEEIRGMLGSALSLVLTLSVAWTLVRLLSVAEDVVAHRFDIDVSDNLRARAIHTQFRIARRIAVVVIGLLSVATLLAGSEEFRELGAGILASAGLMGLVVGFAAQKTLANLLAGIQIAITQPVRLDDVVIVENEWGWIEEITLTYVVVRIWDLRRLVLPISYFLEKPFQNWTRVSADILGTVYLYVDYTVPVDAIREELSRIVAQSSDWDGKVCGVQVTDASDKSVEIRALVSAADSGKAWDLRCEVREKLIAFLQGNYPNCLPRLRAEGIPNSTARSGAPTGE